MKVDIKKRQTNGHQARYLRDRLNAAQRAQRSRIYEMGLQKEPAEVKRARRIVEAFDKGLREARARLHSTAIKRMEAEAHKVHAKMLFSAPIDALRAVEDFEAREL